MAMRPIWLKAKLFTRPNDADDVNRSRLCLLAMAQCLIQINVSWLLLYPDTPRLYESGVLYHEEEEREEWCDIPSTREAGWGDCDDLACWYAAEQRVFRGIQTDPLIKWRQVDKRFMYHMLTIDPDGRQEDPSRRLGMGDAFNRQPLHVFEPQLRSRGRIV